MAINTQPSGMGEALQMAMKGTPEQGTSSMDMFDVPIPGESLTSNPEQRYPFEKAPRFVEVDPAMREIFLRLTEEETLDPILDLMREDVPVEDITQVILFEGFRTGQYTPDLMLLLVEPTIYLLLALAEYAGIEAVLYPEDDMDYVDEEGETSEKTFNAVTELLRTRKEAESLEGSAVTSDREGTISVGGRDITRPAGVSPTLMEDIRSRLGGNGGGSSEELPTEEEMV